MDRERLMKEAENYKGAESCYIHIELKDGECQQLIGGGGLALIHGMCGAIEKMADLGGFDFEEVFSMIRQWHYFKQEADREEE